MLGCSLANSLFKAGKDVTLLARGKWAEEIKENGLRIKNRLLPHKAVSRIPVAEELLPNDAYDIIFVALRYTQLEAAADALRANKTKNKQLPNCNCLHSISHFNSLPQLLTKSLFSFSQRGFKIHTNIFFTESL